MIGQAFPTVTVPVFFSKNGFNLASFSKDELALGPLDAVLNSVGVELDGAHRERAVGRVARGAIGLGHVGNDHLDTAGGTGTAMDASFTIYGDTITFKTSTDDTVNGDGSGFTDMDVYVEFVGTGFGAVYLSNGVS